MTDTFEIGQRVRVTDPRNFFEGEEGTITVSNYATHAAVLVDGVGKCYFLHDQLTSIEQAPESPAKPECYVTAWMDDDGDFSAYGCRFDTKEAADAEAKRLACTDRGYAVAVLKMVSKHSSAVTVTSEDV